MSEQVGTKLRRGAGKNKRKFNFLDGIIIVVLILAAVFTVNFFHPLRRSAETVKPIEYTVELLGVDAEFIDFIKEGDAVIDSVTKHPLGHVKAADYGTHFVLRAEDGKDVGIMEPDDKFDVVVTVIADASYTEGKGYFISDKRIAIGEKMYLRFPNYAGEGYCINIFETN